MGSGCVDLDARGHPAQLFGDVGAVPQGGRGRARCARSGRTVNLMVDVPDTRGGEADGDGDGGGGTAPDDYHGIVPGPQDPFGGSSAVSIAECTAFGVQPVVGLVRRWVAGAVAVSYTHLTLPT